MATNSVYPVTLNLGVPGFQGAQDRHAYKYRPKETDLCDLGLTREGY